MASYITDRAWEARTDPGKYGRSARSLKTMAVPKSRHRERREAVLVVVCAVCLAVPYVVGLAVIYRWLVR